MSAALALETSMKIAYLGPPGSWTHQVAINKFGNSVDYVAEASTEGVFDRVAARTADYGVLPIEHSTEGAVHHTLDHLTDSPLQIYAEILWKTETVLMAQRSDTRIEVIHGHPQVNVFEIDTHFSHLIKQAVAVEKLVPSLSIDFSEHLLESGIFKT
jgi:chorismate mutase/prephenate dehydratase